MKDNKAFCIAPWVHFYSGDNGRVQACCVSGITYGSLYQNSIQEIWQSDKIQSIREKFLIGEKDKRCSYCYKVEESGNESIRQSMNNKYKAYAEKVINNEIEEIDYPVYFDIRFSNVCNLRCRTCWHGASSKWFEDAKLMGEEASDTALMKNLSTKFFEENLDEILEHSEEFYFAGGEPLVTEEVYLILEHLIKKGKQNVLIRINTNLTKLTFGKRSLVALLKHFSKVELQVSLDHVSEKGEYIRKDLRWLVFKKNLLKVKELMPHAKLIIHPTISIFNVYDWPEIEKYIRLEFGLGEKDIALNFLSRPNYYCIQNLSKESKNKILEKYSNFFKSKHLADIIAFLNVVDSKNREAQLIQRLKQLDKIRGEDYKKVLGWLIP